jgi:signal transduction histidine kinase/ligand-binding sensor domain-containing protein
MRRPPITTVFLALLMLGLLPVRAYAQYRFDNWTTDDGLPQNTVSAIRQTHDGYLWLATAGGLVRFDGLRFTVFDKGNSKGLTSVRFSALFEDAEGSLWIGTEDGGLTRYRNGTFTTYTTEQGLPSNHIWSIWSDEAGGLLIHTGNGLVRWQREQFIPYTAQPSASLMKACHRVQSGAFWCVDAGGLHQIRGDKLRTYTIRDGLSSLKLSAVYEDREGNVWIATRDAGLNRLQNDKFTHYTTKDGLPKERVQSIYQDRQNNLWFATLGGGLSQFQAGRFVTYAPTDLLGGNFIPPFSEDREGNLWMGTADHGLRRLKKDFISFYSADGELSQNKPYPILEDHAGTIWIGTQGSGLYSYKDGLFSHHPPAKDGIYISVSALYEDRDGQLWMGGLGGLSWFKDSRPIEMKERFGLSNQLVRVILQDRENRFWLGTDGGLIKYEHEHATSYTTSDGLASNDVIALLEDHVGRIWIGTRGGLSRFEDNKFISFTEQNGLSSNHIRALYEDGEGVLWIGSYDGGLARLSDGKFTRYTVAEGLFNNGVFSILEDKRANLWMSCNRGIYSVSKQQLNDFADGKIQAINSVSYGKADGLLNTECNGNRQPAGWRARDGRFWFPTQGGVAVVDTASIVTNPHAPPIVIEEATLDRKPINTQATVQINPGEENLEIRYAGLSFTKPEYMHFKYKMAGVDKDWIEAGSRRSAYYSHLPPGSYTFKVIGANSDGVWNNEGAALSVVVRPPFWRTWWFLTLATLLVAGVAVLVYESRLARLRRAHAAQESFSRRLIESQESERKRIAGELHDSLGQNLLIIKNRALLGDKVAVEHQQAREQFAEINASASQAIDEVRTIAYNLRPYHLDRLGLTATLEDMIERVSKVSGVQFSSTIAPLDDLFSKEAEISLYRIVQETLNNIVKHAQATEAEVEITRSAQNVSLTVHDNGRGFTPGAASALEAGRHGFGLTGIAERVRMLGGTQEIESAPGQGTTVRIRLSVPTKRGDNSHEN